MIQPPECFSSDRLILRKPVLDDAGAIFKEYATDPEVTRYLTWKPSSKPDHVAVFIAQALKKWDEQIAFTWTITRKDDDHPIGMIDARVDAYMVNIGYVLARRFWNQGLMTEAVRALLGWTDREPEIVRVWAVCAVQNSSSARVLEKAGMIREGILHRWTVFPNVSGQPMDCYCYARVKPAGTSL
jgi:ribosomal-protein-alanine N-acetyltransferase